jgi:hypothetical protein
MLLKCNFIKNNKGSSAIILALSMTAILGFCAIVSDVGLVVLERQKMQNAVDATDGAEWDATCFRQRAYPLPNGWSRCFSS